MARSFGWIQDSGSFDNMKRILRALYNESEWHTQLLQKLEIFVPERCGRAELIKAMEKEWIPYSLLKGAGASWQLTVSENEELFGYSHLEAEKIVKKGGRPNAACSGIAQLCLPAQKTMPNGQKKPYQGDWQADGFLRLGVSIGFLNYDYETDSCALSDTGKNFALTEDGSENEKDAIGDALLKYPPACRVLELLHERGHLTKFEIGNKLGFSGEAGFGNIPQNIVVSGYCMASSQEEKQKIKSDTEGMADKYARMIASWLINIGWVSRIPKNVIDTFAGREYQMEIGQSYVLTIKGRNNCKRILGSSSMQGTNKIVYKDMLATKAVDREYLRDRRALLLDALSTERTLEAIQKILAARGFNEDFVTILDDIRNFSNIGLHIKENQGKYKLIDKIDKLLIPTRATNPKSIRLVAKDSLRKKLENLNHRYLILLDLAYDSESSRDFEIETMRLFTEELSYQGTHLGGASKPDGVFFLQKNGVIVDTKAYSRGYSLPISQADEMIRYIEENKTRGDINPNKWWENFGNQAERFSYLFVSSEFTGGYQDRIDYIKRRTGYSGGVINAENLLLFAEEVKSQRMSYAKSFEHLRRNAEIVMHNNMIYELPRPQFSMAAEDPAAYDKR